MKVVCKISYEFILKHPHSRRQAINHMAISMIAKYIPHFLTEHLVVSLNFGLHQFTYSQMLPGSWALANTVAFSYIKKLAQHSRCQWGESPG